MFKRDTPKEPPEVSALREALKSDDVKVIIQDKDGSTWTFYNDKLRGCIVKVGRSKVEERNEDVTVKFVLYAVNGRVG